MNSCIICQSLSVETIIDFGLQSISNRYLSNKEVQEYKHSFNLGYCHFCSLVQLINPPAIHELKPRFDWITYKEPEGHLDDLVDLLSQLPNINEESSFCGVSEYEDTTLDRLRRKKFLNTWRLELDANLGSCNSLTVIETIQRYLEHRDINQITKNNVRPKVIIARDILEHAHNPLPFMQALREIVDPNGYVVFEVPDYSKNFAICDYSSLWEEHISYFTPFTFIQSLEKGGFKIDDLSLYQYDMQDYLIAIARPKSDEYRYKRDEKLQLTEHKRINQFCTKLPKHQSWYRGVLSRYREKGKIALLGAGHIACHFINLLNLADLIDFLVDDHPNKCGMFMPGSQLPILPSSALENKAVTLCLMSLSQESERKVMQSKKYFTERGGIFASIFSASKNALKSYDLAVQEVD